MKWEQKRGEEQQKRGKATRRWHGWGPVPTEGQPWSPGLASLLAGVGQVFAKHIPSDELFAMF